MAGNVRVRFAPSPTGTLHTGSVRVALFNYIFAKQNNGALVLRIEDTDRQRSTKEYEQDILKGMEWLGLTYDEIYRQSERTGTYEKYLRKLVEENKAYVSREPAKEGSGEVEVIRFKNPNKIVTFTDLIRGEISVNTTDLGDFVIAKSFTEPLFHLVVVIDDFEMGITHIIRGEDHISNTPRHILIQEAIGATRPKYAHLPLILAPDRSKLSKRKHASIASLNEFIKNGYLPEAIINFVALLGWSPQAEHESVNPNEEILSLADLIKLFKLEKVQKSGAIFNVEKLNWINREYLKRLSNQEFADRAKEFWPEAPEGLLVKLAPELKNRLTTLGEISVMAKAGDFDYFTSLPKPDKELLKTTEFLPKIIEHVSKISEGEFTAENLKQALWDFATQKGRGNVLWPMRVALTGKKQSPDPFTVASVLGKTETLKRLNNALAL